VRLTILARRGSKRKCPPQEGESEGPETQKHRSRERCFWVEVEENRAGILRRNPCAGLCAGRIRRASA